LQTSELESFELQGRRNACFHSFT